MDIQAKKQGDVMVVQVSGNMDAVSAPEFQKAFEGWLDANDKLFIVDLAPLEYITSAGLRSILASAKKIKAMNGKIAFCGLKGMVKEVFEMSYFTTMFPIFSNADEAVKNI